MCNNNAHTSFSPSILFNGVDVCNFCCFHFVFRIYQAIIIGWPIDFTLYSINTLENKSNNYVRKRKKKTFHAFAQQAFAYEFNRHMKEEEKKYVWVQMQCLSARNDWKRDHKKGDFHISNRKKCIMRTYARPLNQIQETIEKKKNQNIRNCIDFYFRFRV